MGMKLKDRVESVFDVHVRVGGVESRFVGQLTRWDEDRGEYTFWLMDDCMFVTVKKGDVVRAMVQSS